MKESWKGEQRLLGTTFFLADSVSTLCVLTVYSFEIYTIKRFKKRFALILMSRVKAMRD